MDGIFCWFWVVLLVVLFGYVFVTWVVGEMKNYRAAVRRARDADHWEGEARRVCELAKAHGARVVELEKAQQLDAASVSEANAALSRQCVRAGDAEAEVRRLQSLLLAGQTALDSTNTDLNNARKQLLDAGTLAHELAHRLEHAEQSVREGTARAARDHETITKVRDDADKYKFLYQAAYAALLSVEAKYIVATDRFAKAVAFIERIDQHVVTPPTAELIARQVHKRLADSATATPDTFPASWADVAPGERGDSDVPF